MYSIIATLAYFLTIVSGLYDPVTKVALPHVETYWESWEDGLENFSSNLSDVPVAPMGATHGVNIVNIAFADPRYLSAISLILTYSLLIKIIIFLYSVSNNS